MRKIILEQTEQVSELRNKLTPINFAVGDLTHGQISSFFVPPLEMKKALVEIANVLQREYLLYRLAVSEERFYYDYREFVNALLDNSIYITTQSKLYADMVDGGVLIWPGF